MTYNNALEVSPQWNLPLRIYLKIWKNKCRGSCAKSGLARNVRETMPLERNLDLLRCTKRHILVRKKRHGCMLMLRLDILVLGVRNYIDAKKQKILPS
ncbi:hypothetical protein CsSME_00008537 [Camellia sinensis var. sinensis]